MHENQTFSFFDFELSDIVNYSLNLGETIPDSKIVRKILRSLPRKFRTKAIVIEGSRDINSMRVDELVAPFKHMRSPYLVPKSLKTLPLRFLRTRITIFVDFPFCLLSTCGIRCFPILLFLLVVISWWPIETHIIYSF